MNKQKEAIKKEIDEISLVVKPELEITDRGGNTVRVLSEEDEQYLDNSAEEILEFMRSVYSTELKTEEELNEIYGKCADMWNSVSGKGDGKLNNISFSLVLHRDEAKFITELLMTKTEYDVNTVWYGMEIKNYLEELMQDKKNFSDDDTAHPIVTTPTDLTYIYHLVSQYKPVGLTKSTYRFAEVLKRIGHSSKIFKYYQTKYEHIKKAIEYYITELEGVIEEDENKVVKLDTNNPSFSLIFPEGLPKEKG